MESVALPATVSLDLGEVLAVGMIQACRLSYAQRLRSHGFGVLAFGCGGDLQERLDLAPLDVLAVGRPHDRAFRFVSA